MVRVCQRPDRGWSWVIAAACCFSSLILAGIFRTSGVLFVAFISDYNVTREEASWPMVLCISVLNLTGPFSGILARKFGGRPVIITGAVVAALGISSCYLTTSLKVITFLFGGVFGVGYGFMNTIMPGILNSYFLDLRATANGIANSGSCIGSIILPIAFEHFIDSYGLSGCFLLTGGIVLHITIAGALMRPPPWLSKKLSYSRRQDCEGPVPKTEMDVHKPNGDTEPSEDSSNSKAAANSMLLISNPNNRDLNPDGTASPSDADYPSLTMVSPSVTPATDPRLNTSKSDIQSGDDGKKSDHNLDEPRNVCTGVLEQSKTSMVACPVVVSNPNDPDFEPRIDGTTDRSTPVPHVGQGVPLEGTEIAKAQTSSETDVERKADHAPDDSNRWSCLDTSCRFLEDRCGSTFSGIVQPFKIVLVCPMFYVTAMTNVTFYFLYHMYVVIIVDYALDSGVPDDSTKYILFAFSLADLFGRLCLGWITDKKFVDRTRFVMLCMVLIGAVFFVFPSAKGYWSLIAVSCGYGLLLGCTMVVFPILLVDFLGIELHSVSYGCMCFMNGFASFGRPFLIGYFRDSVGSYSSMFYVLGTISVAAAMLWLLDGIFQKKRE